MKRTVFGLGVAAVILVGVFVLLPLGCKPQANSGSGGNSASDNVLWRSELFDFAVDALLNKTDEHYSDEIQQRNINRLDQWVRLQKPLEGWEPDTVIAGVTEELLSGSETLLGLAQQIRTLQQGDDPGSLDKMPAEFRSAAARFEMAGRQLALLDVLQLASQMATMADQLQEIIDQTAATPGQTTEAIRAAFLQFNLEQFALIGGQLQLLSRRIDPSILEFPAMDSPAFREAVWLRNVSTWASGEELDAPVKPAIALFDWVVKNVDLVRESKTQAQSGSVRMFQTPTETMLFGQGTGIDRAWLFVLLARQMNIDAALLGLADENNNLTKLWGVGVLIDEEVYLFEPVLGLPIPKLGSLELAENGLAFEPATLSEAAENEAVLEQLDVFQEGSYAVRAKDLQRVVALVEASPSYLSQRMKMVENRLTGNQKIVLTTDATAQIERFKQCPYVIGSQMWPLPYQTIWQEIRFRAERQQWVLSKFRPFIFPQEKAYLWRARDYYFKGQFTGNPSATAFYQEARRSDFAMNIANIDAQDRLQWQEIKIDASYWLGLMVAQTGNYRAAEDYLKTRVLLANPGGKWEYGATYNLARLAETTGDIPMAIKLYRIHLAAPQTQGNLIRARWLSELTGHDDLSPKPAPAPKEEGNAESPEGEEAEKASETPPTDMEAEQVPGETVAKESPAESSPAPSEESPKPKSDSKPETPKAEEQPPAEAPKKPDEEAPASKDQKPAKAPTGEVPSVGDQPKPQ
jgi:hypothetical protein